ncbi:MAG: hypothetical protein ACOC8L_06975 [Spirochaetota bacterium]
MNRGLRNPVSPAATALDHVLRIEGPLHRMRLKETGRLEIARELVEAGLAAELEDGHVVSIDWVAGAFDRILDTLPCDHKTVAKTLELSNGLSRALLAHLVRDGMIKRSEGRFSIASAKASRG